MAGSCTGVWGNTLTQVAAGSLTFTANGSGGAKTTVSTNLALNTCYSYSATLLADTSTPIPDLAGRDRGRRGGPRVGPGAAPAPHLHQPDLVGHGRPAHRGDRLGGRHRRRSRWPGNGRLVPGGTGHPGQREFLATANWTGATTALPGDSGTIGFTADGNGDATVTTPATGTAPLAGPGCYTWLDTVNGSTFPGSTTPPPRAWPTR